MAQGKANEYVIVDIETTGLDARTDDIIEIAAVKVRRGMVTEEFSTLVHADKPLPSLITELTGISVEMLAGQPTATEAVARLAEFIGTAEIAAHNASFDAGFIHRYWPDERPWLDTIALAQVAFPALSSYSLANICEALHIENEHAHRALGDARATARLFLRARKQLAALPPKAREDLLTLAGTENAPLEELIRRQCGAQGAVAEDEASPKAEPRRSPRQADEDYRIPLADIAEFFAPDGLYQQRMPGFEYREAQLKMAEQVAISLNEGRFLLAEAGTGTGKSLAYLLPAALFALNGGRQVAVSTHTINLQEQLLKKDIPLLEKLLQRSLHAVVLKGRGNYLCRRIYRSQLRGPGENMRYFLMRLAAWLPVSESGDGGELNLSSYDKWRWQRVCAASENCAPGCPYFKSGCFVSRARREVDKADIFILNHSLLIANAARESGFLPPLPYLIVDEAHHLERAAEDQLTEQVDFYTLLRLLSRLRRHERGRRAGLLDALAREAQALIGTKSQQKSLDDRLAALDESIEQTVRQAEQFYGLLQQRFLTPACADGYFPARLRLLPVHRQADGWDSVADLGQGLAALLTELARHLALFSEMLHELAGASGAELNGREELQSTANLAGGMCATLLQVLEEPAVGAGEGNTVCWLEFPAADKLPSLNVAPLELGEILKNDLFDRTESLIFTSATITSAGSFSYCKKRLGLDLLETPPGELLLPSPFFYREQALLTLCTDLPDWSKAGEIPAQEALAGALLKLISASKGRALVLFTSHAQLKAVYDLLKTPLREQGVTVLAHGISGEPAHLLARLHKEPRCCILGANSFWEGVDVTGSALSLVIVVRLPFWPPNTPTTAARLERIEAEGGSSFYEYSLPQAVLRFKQGFGRLIRSTEDTGVFCVLDKRIREKSYGRVFLKSLPDMQVVSGPSEDIGWQIERWLG